MSIAEIIGFSAGAIGLTQSIPQSFRLRKLGHGRGVSTATWTLNFLLNSSWIGYGIKTHSPSVAMTNSLSLFFTTTILVSLLQTIRNPWPAIFVVGILVIAISSLIPQGITSFLVILLTLARLPQVIQSYKNMNNDDANAVSISSILISIMSLILWETFAILENRHVVMLTTAIGLTLTTAIAYFELKPMTKRA